MGFGGVHQLLADATALLAGIDREHAEVALAVDIGDVGTGHQLAVAFGQQDGRARAVQVALDAFGIDAGAVQQVGFGGPANAAGVAAVGRGDQGDQGGDVGRRGGAEGQGAHGGILGGVGASGEVADPTGFAKCVGYALLTQPSFFIHK
ncbi:hypothetical protein D3C72_1963490 [compost metagenome]